MIGRHRTITAREARENPAATPGHLGRIMATYLYETLALLPDGTPVRRFEHTQSMKAPALARDPESGLPVRRVPLGGYGLITGARGYSGAIAQPTTAHPAGGDCCGTC